MRRENSRNSSHGTTELLVAVVVVVAAVAVTICSINELIDE